jgi:hypothetical protein
MKTKVIILTIIMLLWASPALAIELNDLPEFHYEIGQIKNEPAQTNIELEKQGFWDSRDPWTKQDTYWQIGVLVTQVIDWGQTREIVVNPEYYEKNPILGEEPTLQEVNRYFIVCITGNYLIAKVLPKNWRRKWQVGSISCQAYYINNNYELGIKMKI